VTLVIAHRGASAAAPENTVAAFRLAAELGADGVELDARRTVDGATVVHHDAHLPDGRLIVATGTGDLPAAVPSLADALAACAGLIVNIEIKNLPGDPDHDPHETVAEAVVAEIADSGIHDRVLVSSFSMASVDRVRALDARVPTAFLLFAMDDMAEMLARTVDHGHAALHPWDGIVDDALIVCAHGHGLAVNVWTVDDPQRMATLVGWGVDGIVTNEPDVARRVVDERR